MSNEGGLASYAFALSSRGLGLKHAPWHAFRMYIARMQVSPNIKECRAAQLGALVRALGVPLPTLMLPIRGGLSWSTPRPEWGQANALNANVGLKASCAQKAIVRSAKSGPQHKV